MNWTQKKLTSFASVKKVKTTTNLVESRRILVILYKKLEVAILDKHKKIQHKLE